VAGASFKNNRLLSANTAMPAGEHHAQRKICLSFRAVTLPKRSATLDAIRDTEGTGVRLFSWTELCRDSKTLPVFDGAEGAERDLDPFCVVGSPTALRQRGLRRTQHATFTALRSSTALSVALTPVSPTARVLRKNHIIDSPHR
jgi:hypothetical protein